MIQINLLRVSPDSNYVEFSVECTVDYVFNTLYIARYNPSTSLYDSTIDCSNLLQGTTTKEIIRIATSIFGTDVTMYKVTFGITPTNGGAEYAPQIGVCSNVNFVYENLLSLILNFTNCCISDTDYANLDRNYMILYAHQEALRLERFSEAEYFYNIIWNLFTNCGPTSRPTNIVNIPCNCV